LSKAAQDLLNELADKDIQIWKDAEKLRVNASKGSMTPGLQQQIRRLKPELLALLEKDELLPISKAPLPSPQQESLWSLVQLNPESSQWNIPLCYQIKGALDPLKVRLSLQSLQQRHEILRYRWESQEKPQIALLHPDDLSIEEKDFSHLTVTEALLRAQQTAQEFLLQKIPLEQRSWQSWIGKITSQDWLLVISFHHLIFDGPSKDLFMQAFERAYDNSNPPAQRHLQYEAFGIWQQRQQETQSLKQSLIYWQAQIKGLYQAQHLPLAHRPEHNAAVGAGRNVNHKLSHQLIRAVEKAAPEFRCTPFMWCLNVLLVLLHCHTGQINNLVCIPVSGRQDKRFNDLIGYCNQQVLIRHNLQPEQTFKQSLLQLRDTVLEAFAQTTVPFHQISRLPELENIPLNRVLFSFREQQTDIQTISGLTFKPFVPEQQRADFRLAFYLQPMNGAYQFRVRYDTAWFTEKQINQLIEDYEKTLQHSLQLTDDPLSSFPVRSTSVEALKLALSYASDILSSAVLMTKNGPWVWIKVNPANPPDLQHLMQELSQQLPAYLLPTEIRITDRLPQKADGSIDFSGFSQAQRLSRKPMAAETPLQQFLLDIWSQVLWAPDGMGIDDHFQDLGGHSLLAVRLIQNMETALGKTLPLQARSRLTTVRELSRLLEQSDPLSDPIPPQIKTLLQQSGLNTSIYLGILAHFSTWPGQRLSAQSLITRLHDNNARTALFWCFQAEREFKALAQALGTSQTLYGMRSGHLVMEKSLANIQALARYYALEMLSHPHQARILGGNCQAAKIAIRIAKSLQQHNQTVQLLILQEQFIPLPYDGPVCLLFGQCSEFNPHAYFDSPEDAWRYFYTGPVITLPLSGQHGEFFEEPSLSLLARHIKQQIQHTEKIKSPQKPDLKAMDEAPKPQWGVPLKTLFLPPKQSLEIKILICNAGNTSWLATVSNPLQVGAFCYPDTSENVLNFFPGETLSQTLEPQQQRQIHLKITAPKIAGRYRYRIDLLSENRVPFSEMGGSTATLNIEVGELSRGRHYQQKLYLWLRTWRDKLKGLKRCVL